MKCKNSCRADLVHWSWSSSLSQINLLTFRLYSRTTCVCRVMFIVHLVSYFVTVLLLCESSLTLATYLDLYLAQHLYFMHQSCRSNLDIKCVIFGTIVRNLPSLFQCFDTVGWVAGRASSPRKTWVMRCSCGYLSGMRCKTCWCHCNPIISSAENPEWLSFWYWPTQVFPEKKTVKWLSVCVCQLEVHTAHCCVTPYTFPHLYIVPFCLMYPSTVL